MERTNSCWTLVFFVGAFFMLARASSAQEQGGDPNSGDETQFGLKIIDAQGYAPNLKHGIDGDPTAETDAEFDREGVLADGVSVLIIRLDPINWHGADVTFTIEYVDENPLIPQNDPAYSGSFSTNYPTVPCPDPGTGVPNFGFRSAIVSAGKPKLVFYRPPNSYFFHPDKLFHEMTVSATVAGKVVASKALFLHRPTVMFSHGVASSSDSMDKIYMPFVQGGHNDAAVKIDWSNLNTSGFNKVSPYIQSWIKDEIIRLRGEKVAATRLDFCGHSMGGIIARWYASDLPTVTKQRKFGFPELVWSATDAMYKRADNFGTGDIHRLVSIDSPFWGSPYGQYVAKTLGYPVVLFTIRNSPVGGYTGDGCAVYDLGQPSEANALLNNLEHQPRVQWLPIAGLGTPGKTEADFSGFWRYLSDVVYASPSQLNLTPVNSDFVVPRRSQSKGDGHIFKTIMNTTHTSVQSDIYTIDLVRAAFDRVPNVWNDPGERPAVTERPGYDYFNPSF